ncbi:hypothetical protein EYF80_035675 [Liparis tanakae]|uniref:Uncharacterized protein n=1 Tax=Liparis tanakae TaxID=230148 RepID=A0A4Z2GKW6_9TELE|nr:hypothetical protein EYF80_035675 [Liparis tanakae]
MVIAGRWAGEETEVPVKADEKQQERREEGSCDLKRREPIKKQQQRQRRRQPSGSAVGRPGFHGRLRVTRTSCQALSLNLPLTGSTRASKAPEPRLMTSHTAPLFSDSMRPLRCSVRKESVISSVLLWMGVSERS